MSFLKNLALRNGLIVYITTFTLGVFIAIYRAFTGKDFMDTHVFDSEILYNITGEFKHISWWPISHFIMYLILGLIAPKYWLLWFSIGIGWEIFEWLGGKILISTGKGNLNVFRSRHNQQQYGNNWVTGTITDIIFNGLGLGIGVLISQKLNKNKK